MAKRTSRSVFTFTKFEKCLIDKIDNKSMSYKEYTEILTVYRRTSIKNIKIRRKKKL